MNAPLPDEAEFVRTLAPKSPRVKALQKLHPLLLALDPAAALSRRVDDLEHLIQWLRASGKLPVPDGAIPADSPQAIRVRYLLHALRTFPELRFRIRAVLCTTFAECSGLELFANVGIPGDRGFFAETVERLSRRLLPEPLHEQSLTQFLARMFPKQRDLLWLSGLSDSLVIEVAEMLAGDDPSNPWQPLTTHVGDSLALLGTRISAVGLSEPIRVRSPSLPLQSSPFFKLPRACDALWVAYNAPQDGGLTQEDPAHALSRLVEDCHQATRAVVQNLEERGVSVDVVYRIELLGASLRRLVQLSERLTARTPAERFEGSRDLLVHLLEARLAERSLREIVKGNLHLLARKIIERTGHTGEHYITSTRGEYFVMLVSAGGGGALTAGTTALKFFIARLHLPLFGEGLASAVNYAGSFLLMQALGCTLATKQPSMTASALAGSLRRAGNAADLSELVAMIARITRSQLAAAVGNIFLVIPFVIGVDQLYRSRTGQPLLNAESAEYVLSSLHPTASGTVFYAAFTGVLLWASSIGAGWLENWATYRRIPEAIAEHRLGRVVGRRTLAWASRVFSRNIAGFGGNVTLGTLLGMIPVFGKFMGLPLDVRHVTLSTGALTLSVCSLGAYDIDRTAFGAAALGIVAIGLLNFGVSFVLALMVALRAREVDSKDTWRLFGSVLVTFFRSPLQFLFPPKGGAPSHH